MVDQTLFEMDISRDDIQLIITDEEGGTLRVYPTDSRITVRSVANSVDGGSCIIGVFYNLQNGDSSRLPRSSGVSTASSTSACIGNLSPYSAGTVPAPSITGMILQDSDGELLVTGAGTTTGGTAFDELLTRNANYTLMISSLGLTSDLSYGKSQETKTMTCFQDGTSRYVSQCSTTPASSGCGFAGVCYSTTTCYISSSGFTTGAIQCNLP